MASIELTDDEVAALGEVLTRYLADTRYEIADTDNARFREELKAHYEQMRGIAVKLGIDPTTA